MSARDHLFLFAPGFEDGPGTSWFCPYSAKVEGLLTYAPELEQVVDVQRIAFPKPRKPLVAMLGESLQSCPMLVLAEAHADHPDALRSEATGRAYISDTDRILDYLAVTYRTPRPHP
jgi:hypothetical protein